VIKSELTLWQLIENTATESGSEDKKKGLSSQFKDIS